MSIRGISQNERATPVAIRILIISPKRTFKVPVEAECISPDRLSALGVEDVGKLNVYEGSRLRKFGDIFSVEERREEGEGEPRIVLDGDFGKVWRIGEGMSSGEIEVKGDCGHFLGVSMRGGAITVHGNAGSYIGAEMEGGSIEIHGNAGDHVGGRFRGERAAKAMKGGEIRIRGNVGAEVGAGLRGGLIVVDGSCKSMPGYGMSGGTILIRGDCEGMPGARATGGRIVICGVVGGILPTYYITGTVPSTKVKGEKIEGPFYLFAGDVMGSISCGCRLFVSAGRNPELKAYEELLKIEELE